MIHIPVSLGEIADKLSILIVKREKIEDETKLRNIKREIEELERVCESNGIDFGDELDELIDINEELWMILQKQRDMESRGDLGDEYIKVSIKVHEFNDERFMIKQRVNEKFNSDIVEEKHYD